MNHTQHPQVSELQVEVFDRAARGESMGLRVQVNDALRDVHAMQVASIFLGKRCYFGWPFLKEGLVSAVSDIRGRVEETNPSKYMADSLSSRIRKR